MIIYFSTTVSVVTAHGLSYIFKDAWSFINMSIDGSTSCHEIHLKNNECFKYQGFNRPHKNKSRRSKSSKYGSHSSTHHAKSKRWNKSHILFIWMLSNFKAKGYKGPSPRQLNLKDNKWSFDNTFKNFHYSWTDNAKLKNIYFFTM